VFGSSPVGTRAAKLNNADIVVWQSSRRLMFAGAIGALAVLLRMTGLVAGPGMADSRDRAGRTLRSSRFLTVLIERRQNVTRVRADAAVDGGHRRDFHVRRPRDRAGVLSARAIT
jgi:hypothetical protein